MHSFVGRNFGPCVTKLLPNTYRKPRKRMGYEVPVRLNRFNVLFLRTSDFSRQHLWNLF